MGGDPFHPDAGHRIGIKGMAGGVTSSERQSDL
jgi:hypothetical protein